jgi:hypothetical protein
MSGPKSGSSAAVPSRSDPRYSRSSRRVAVSRENGVKARAALAAKRDREREETAGPPAFVAAPTQNKFIEAVFSGLYRLLAMGGGIRGTKTWTILAVFVLLCRIFPRSRWAIVRKDLPTIKRNLLPSFNKFRRTCSNFVGEVNRSDWVVKCTNGSEIIFFAESLPQDPDYDRWHGLEVNGFALEESSELAIGTYHKAIERAGAWIIPAADDDPEPKQPAPFILLTFNVCDNWPREEFYDPWEAGKLAAPKFFLPATIEDNPFAPESYKEGLKDLPEREYRRFVKGIWDSIVNPNQLIRYEWIRGALEVEAEPGPTREALDVGRGGDPSVAARIRGNALIELEAWDTDDLAELTDIAQLRMINGGIPANEYRIDAVGNGAGVADHLRARGMPVVDFIAGAKMIERRVSEKRGEDWRLPAESLYEFKDLRSQAWYEFAQRLARGEFRINPDDHPSIAARYKRLVQELLAVEIEVRNDRVLKIESKDDIRPRLGRSTNDADALIMAAFDLPRFLPLVFRSTDFPKLRR